MKIGGSEVVRNGKREPKFLSGEQWRVKRREGNRVIIERNRAEKELPLPQAKHFSAYRTERLALSVGDRVRITKNLMVSSPAGVVVIRGPGVSDYHEKLAQGIADLVEANGKEITSVLYYPPAYGESEDELDAEEIAESR